MLVAVDTADATAQLSERAIAIVLCCGLVNVIALAVIVVISKPASAL